jgi:hypothetical protein
MSDPKPENVTNLHPTETRVLCVRVPVAQFRVVRRVAVTHDLKNSEVITWAIELLDRHVRSGGER